MVYSGWILAFGVHGRGYFGTFSLASASYLLTVELHTLLDTGGYIVLEHDGMGRDGLILTM